MFASLKPVWLFFAAILICLGVFAGAQEIKPYGGELRIIGPEGQTAGVCPLKHTDVQADIAGFVARVHVRQTFNNPTKEKIEAVYGFPLPHESAVDEMTMTIGSRRIVAKIKPREEARAIFDAARAKGQVASLLDQERPNIFTQSVTNIEPGVEIQIEIDYNETLKLEETGYQFVFPMVVGPRYNPGAPTGKAGTGMAPDTTQVPDASKISPPITPEGTRAGHDISLAVTIDAPMGLSNVKSTQHEVSITNPAAGRTRVALKNLAEIPNKDFILNYRLAAKTVSDAFYVYSDERGQFFLLALQPPERVTASQTVPKEMIFVIDRSGSMSNRPIEKAKETMKLCIEGMNPKDTFNLLSFSRTVEDYMGGLVPNTPENRAKALEKLAGLKGGGGTNMIPSLEKALGDAGQPGRLRIVCFMTDGFIGNDMAAIDTVQKYLYNARLFSFGVGTSVNRYLLDGMAKTGGGAAEFVSLNDPADQAAKRFAERIQSPVLTDIKLDWSGLEVEDVYPKQIPDVFSRTPIMITGRIKGPIGGTVTLRGNNAAGKYEKTITITPTKDATPHEVIPSLWARAKVEELMLTDLQGIQRGNPNAGVKEAITGLGVAYHIMTQFTSFVAVEEMTVTVAGTPKKIAVPVEMPEGVSYEGIFGPDTKSVPMMQSRGQMRSFNGFSGGGSASGSGMGGGGGGMGRGGRGGVRAGAKVAPSSPGATTYNYDSSRVDAPAVAPKPAANGPVIKESYDPARGTASTGDIWRVKDGPSAAGTPQAAVEAKTNATVRKAQVAPMDAKPAPSPKIAEPLRGLAEKVQKDGREGALTIGKLKIVDYKIDVMITLKDMSDATLKALTDLGFKKNADVKAAKVVIGAIDIRKLEDLAKLEGVLLIEPVE